MGNPSDGMRDEIDRMIDENVKKEIAKRGEADDDDA